MQRKRDLWHGILMTHPPCSPDIYAHSARGAITQNSMGWWSLLLLCCLCTAHPAWAARCLFISSYHQGYAWSDGVEHGLRPSYRGTANSSSSTWTPSSIKSPQEIAQKALEAKALIEAWHPDVVITADDDAAQYLIMPFYKDHTIPFVFCGINWTVKEYGFPYRNVTGMVEVAPIEPLFDQVKALLTDHSRGFYLGANTSTERKNLERFQAVASRRGIQLDASLVDTTEAWLAAFHRAQTYDFIALGSNSGINDWQDTAVIAQD